MKLFLGEVTCTIGGTTQLNLECEIGSYFHRGRRVTCKRNAWIRYDHRNNLIHSFYIRYSCYKAVQTDDCNTRPECPEYTPTACATCLPDQKWCCPSQSCCCLVGCASDPKKSCQSCGGPCPFYKARVDHRFNEPQL